MANQEFQELKDQYYKVANTHIKPITDKMRENLIKRNNNNPMYEFQYNPKYTTLSIMLCNIEELFAIDGEMNLPKHK